MRKRKKEKTTNPQPFQLPGVPPCLETPGIIAHMHVSSRPVAQREKERENKKAVGKVQERKEIKQTNNRVGGLGV